MTPPTPPTAQAQEQKHTPTPWFVHEYYPQKQSEPLYSIGSDGHTAADGSHIAIAINICRAEDARAIVESVNSHAALRAEVKALRAIKAAAVEYLKIHDSKGGEDYDGSLAPLRKALLTPEAK